MDEELAETNVPTVGERLRAAREEKGISLEDIASQTRIPRRHLESLEVSDWEKLPAPLLYRMAYYPTQQQTGDPPAAFYDYLRYLWVADGRKGFEAFGEPAYTTKEAWISFISSRRMRRYR